MFKPYQIPLVTAALAGRPLIMKPRSLGPSTMCPSEFRRQFPNGLPVDAANHVMSNVRAPAKKTPSLAELVADADRAKAVWVADFRRLKLGLGKDWSVPVKDRLKNNGLWRRWKNRAKKAAAAQIAARPKVPPGYTAEELDRDNPYTQHICP